MIVAGMAGVAFGQSQPELTAKAEAEFEKADGELNALYKKKLGEEDEEGRKKLIASERAWVAYRDAEASYEADAKRGGSMEPMIYNEACARLTRERMKELSRETE